MVFDIELVINDETKSKEKTCTNTTFDIWGNPDYLGNLLVEKLMDNSGAPLDIGVTLIVKRVA